MILRAIRRVQQIHDSGCFIACTAMLLGTTYEEAFKLIHPDKDLSQIDPYTGKVHLPVEESIWRLLGLGLNPKPARIRNLRNLRRTSLLLIRWSWDPASMHGVVFDAASNRLLDPAYERPLKIDTYQKQLDSVFYFNVPELTHRRAA